jgi:hypothetical protein
MSWIACMAHIKHEHKEYIESYIDNRFTQYIIAYETSPKVGEHIHFILWAEDAEDYHKLATAVFRQKFKLRGKAVSKKCRQYGKVKEIEDINKMMAYTVKDSNVTYKINDENKEQLALAFETSFKKNDKLTQLNNIMLKYIDYEKREQYNHHDDTPCPGEYDYSRSNFIKEYTKQYYTLFEKVPTRNMLINAVVKYDKNGIEWYLDTCNILNSHNNYNMEYKQLKE